MANRNAKLFETVSYRNAAGETTDIVITGIQKAAPDNAGYTLTPSASGGTLANGTYSYRVSIVEAGVESPASTAKTTAVTGPTGSVTIDATALLAAHPQATHWKLFGRVGASEALMATTVRATPTFVDTNAVTPSGAVKAANGAIAGRDRGTKTNLTQIAKATAVKQTGVYYHV